MLETLLLAGVLFANLWGAAALEWLTGEQGEATPIPMQPWVGDRIVEAPRNDTRVPILPPIKAGEMPLCENPPSEAEILRALGPITRGVPYVYDQYRTDVEFTVEKLVDRLDAPRFFPLIGPAQLHHCHWKCTVYFTETIETAHPWPFKAKMRKAEVVYIDTDHLHLFVAGTREGAEPSEAPKTCPGGHFNPAKPVPPAPRADREPQIQFDITVVGLDCAKLPDARRKAIRKELGLTGDGVVSCVARGAHPACSLVSELRDEGLASVLAQPRVTTLSGQRAHFQTGGEMPVAVDSANGPAVTYKHFGIQLDLVGTLKSGGKIEVEASPEIASLAGLDNVRGKITATVADGQTIAIGGLKQNHTTHGERRVPFLGNLPGVGGMFAWEEDQQGQRELLILVTPRIVQNVDAIPPARSPFPTVNAAARTPAASAGKVYVIVQRGSDGEEVTVLAANEQSVLDTIAGVKSIATGSIQKVRVARIDADGKGGNINLPVDWKAITERGQTATNYQLEAGDRVFVYYGHTPVVKVEDAVSAKAPAMTIDDVVKMSKAGVATKIILRQMELTNAVFNLTTDEIIHLRKEGVNNRVISAMQERRTSASSSDPFMRMEQQLIEAENLRQLHDAWRRFWMQDQPARVMSSLEPPAKGEPKREFERARVVPDPRSRFAEPEEQDLPAQGRAGQGESAPAISVTTFWYEQIYEVADAAKGKSVPGIAGRVWLASENTKAVVEANGCFFVEMYNTSAQTPVKLAEWRFDAATLKSLKRTDIVGPGYTLFLPWDDYRAEITQVELRVLYMPEDGSRPRRAEPQILRLRTKAGEPGR
jgi:hypothetical protein